MRLVALVVLGVGAACSIWYLLRTRPSEVVLAVGVTLDSEWQELVSPEPMRTTRERSELLLELPGLEPQRAMELIRAGHAGIGVEGYLTTFSGDRVDLGE